MEKWKRAENYFGKDMSEWYILISKTRDSKILAQSNFDVAFNLMGGEETDTIQIHKFNHWGCGWIETIMIHESDSEAVMKGEDIEASLLNYPILDDEDYWDKEHEYAMELWTDSSIRERVEYCNEARESIFAARHECPPAECLAYLTIDA